MTPSRAFPRLFPPSRPARLTFYASIANATSSHPAGNPSENDAHSARPVGLMDKASASGAGDSRFESWAGHFLCNTSITTATGPKQKVRWKTTARGFEPLRAEPNGFLVHHLNHSVTLSTPWMCDACILSRCSWVVLRITCVEKNHFVGANTLAIIVVCSSSLRAKVFTVSAA